MQVDYLIIGQGLCGSFLSHELQKRNQSFLVIDDARSGTASKIASGIINPVTGRRIVKTWMIDELMPFAWNAYQEIERDSGQQCIREIGILDFFPTPQMRMAFLDRLATDGPYLSLPSDSRMWLDYLQYDFGFGLIQPSYLVDLTVFLQACRNALVQKQQLMENHFDQDNLTIHDKGVQYNDIHADKIIFCDGNNGFHNNWFKNLPFAPNKGEALIVEIQGLPTQQAGLPVLLKKGISIVPWKDDLFWIGASHEWHFTDDKPTETFLKKTILQLQGFCKLPFKIMDHLAAVRPATIERRPFIGFHPVSTNVGIFNGMGTKGCSLAPYLARQFVDHLVTGSPLMPEADVLRFRKVLSRG
ncbi:MAG: FAD-binding oxidoreductase [Chitinophagaceae bacterium]